MIKQVEKKQTQRKKVKRTFEKLESLRKKNP